MSARRHGFSGAYQAASAPDLGTVLTTYGGRWSISRGLFCWEAIERPTPTAVNVIVAPDLATLAGKLAAQEPAGAQ
jgi:hypothetical protein